jgi:hypothetical protein
MSKNSCFIGPCLSAEFYYYKSWPHGNDSLSIKFIYRGADHYWIVYNNGKRERWDAGAYEVAQRHVRSGEWIVASQEEALAFILPEAREKVLAYA